MPRSPEDMVLIAAGARTHHDERAARSRDGAALRLTVALLAGCALLLGALVYFFDRSPGSAYLLPASLSFFDGASARFGGAGVWLPAFLHPLAFSLLTALVLGVTRVTAVASSAAWWLTDSLFEIGQHPAVSARIADALPSWFDGVPVLENTAAYFVHGTYDPWDLAAVAAGAAVACFVLLCVLQYRGHHHAASV